MVAIACSSCTATVQRDPLATIPEPPPPFVAALSQPAPQPDVAGAGAVVRVAEEPKPAATAAEPDAKTPEAAAPVALPPQAIAEASSAPPPAVPVTDAALWAQADGQPRRSADSAAVLIEVRDQILALRRHLEATSDALRSEIEQLKAAQLKLRAQIERAPRGAAMASAQPAPVAVGSTEPSSGATAEKPAGARSEDVAGGTTPPKREPALAPTVIVSGSVRKPGVYSVAGVKTLGGAIQAAGKRDDANVGAVEVRSANQESALLGIALGMGAPSSKTVVDLSAIASGKTADLPLRGGEVIFVPASGR